MIDCIYFPKKKKICLKNTDQLDLTHNSIYQFKNDPFWPATWCEIGVPQKKRFGYLLRHLSFWVNGMESPLIFLYTKKKKKTNYKIHDWIVSFIDWIKEITCPEKLQNYIDSGPSYNLPNIYMVCCPSYILLKTNEDKARSTKPKT